MCRSESQVKAYIPTYEPLQVSKCEKFGKVMTELKELIRIQQQKGDRDV